MGSEPARDGIDATRALVAQAVVGRERELDLILAAVYGPLATAMRRGGFLYIEEFNRAPEDTLNTLLTAMAEREVTIPRAGVIRALGTFRVIASMNPYDNVGTARLSTSVHDRMCRLAVGYQDADAELEIVRRRAGLDGRAADLADQLRADAVALTRATREHPAIRQGSSVRGAIDPRAPGRAARRRRDADRRRCQVAPAAARRSSRTTTVPWPAVRPATSRSIHRFCRGRGRSPSASPSRDRGGTTAGAAAARSPPSRTAVAPTSWTVDATLDSLAQHPVPGHALLYVRERVRRKRSVVLLVDVSGSMRGERIRTAAATVGALTAEFSRDDVGVVAFWSDAAVVQPLGLPHAPGRIFDTPLRIPARGLTNVAFPLQVAQRQLAQARPREARVLLLSDCVHNAGPDPRPDAARLPRLDILLDTSGEHDAELARDLARFGRGRLAAVHSYRDVAPALAALFAP